MLRRSKNVIQMISAIYSIIVMLYITYIQSSLIPLIPVIILVLALVIKSLHNLFSQTLLATVFFISLIIDLGIYLAIPLAVLMPFTVRRKIESSSITHMGVFGPSSFYVLKLLILSTLFMFLDIRILIPIAISSITILFLTIYNFVVLSKVKTSITTFSNIVSLGERLPIILTVEAPFRVYVFIDYGIGRGIQSVKDRGILGIEIPATHVGKHVVELNVYVLDTFLFSYRGIARYFVEYRVTPLTQKILNVVAKSLEEVAELRSVIPTIEISLLELGEGITSAPIYGEKAVEIIRKYVVSKTVLGNYLLPILRRFAEVLSEVVSKTSGEQYGLNKGRYGEYAGSRHYIPGDSLRYVHWKKSISRGILIVKEFTTSGIDTVFSVNEHVKEPIIIVDLYAQNIYELDNIIHKFLRLCLEILRLNPLITTLIIIVVGDVVIGLKGRITDILYQLYKTFKELNIQMLFTYPTIPSLNERAILELVKVKKKTKPLAIIVLHNESFAKSITKIILENGFTPPKPFIIVHSSALTFRYTITKYRLNEYGFVYVEKEFFST